MEVNIVSNVSKHSITSWRSIVDLIRIIQKRIFAFDLQIIFTNIQ